MKAKMKARIVRKKTKRSKIKTPEKAAMTSKEKIVEKILVSMIAHCVF
jgi:hypothetical protein